MADADDSIELLFFDTFSHEIHEVNSICVAQHCHKTMQNAFRVIYLPAILDKNF